MQTIRDDIEKEAVTHVMIAACSRRAKTEAFHFPTVAMARANLREGVLWAVAAGSEHDEVRQEMAADYVRMGCAELKKMKVPAGNSRRRAGIGASSSSAAASSGMTAALEAARDRATTSLLVEKEAQLGGWAARLWKRVPWKAPHAEPQETGRRGARRRGSPRIRGSACDSTRRSRETAGAPGRFRVRVAPGAAVDHDEEVGAIVQATGFEAYDLAKLPELGGGKSPQRRRPGRTRGAGAGGERRRRSDAPTAREVKSVVFVQCAGQRDESGMHLPYCSGHCCATSIKQAMYFKDANPAVDTVVLYTDLRVPGMGEDFYRRAQEKGVTFTKGRASAVDAAGEACTVRFRDLILDEEVGARRRPGRAGDRAGRQCGRRHRPAPTTRRQRRSRYRSSTSNYRQGRDLPQLKHGFSDSHFICFPYETRRTGIYAAGPVRRPMDIAQATEDATGAALKAIQAIENAASGPRRASALRRPLVSRSCASKAARSASAAPSSARSARSTRTRSASRCSTRRRCRRCGTCMGACPVRVISFENYSVDTVGVQIKAVDMPDEFSEKPRILVLACENDAYPALDMAGHAAHTYSAFVARRSRCAASARSTRSGSPTR